MNVSKLKDCKFANEDERIKALEALYAEDVKEYIRQCGSSTQFAFSEKEQWKWLKDCLAQAGNAGDYFFQDMWAAREIYRSNVKHVYDIGSRLDGYIAHLLAMEVQVTLLDIRPLDRHIEGIDYIQTDAMDMSNIPDNSIETLSSLCALEHFGLGRYSDPIDYNGWKKALHAIKRKIKVGGTFYMSVPVGVERVRFNAHRVFHPLTIVNEMLPEMILHEFSYIDLPNSRIETCLKGGNGITSLDLWMQNYIADYRPVLDFVTKNKIGRERVGLFTFKKPIFTPPHTA